MSQFFSLCLLALVSAATSAAAATVPTASATIHVTAYVQERCSFARPDIVAPHLTAAQALSAVKATCSNGHEGSITAGSATSLPVGPATIEQSADNLMIVEFTY